MSSSGWLRVAAGIRLVASSAAQHASGEAGSIAVRAAQHGVDLATNLRNVSAVQQQQYHQPQQNQKQQKQPQQNGTPYQDTNLHNNLHTNGATYQETNLQQQQHQRHPAESDLPKPPKETTKTDEAPPPSTINGLLHASRSQDPPENFLKHPATTVSATSQPSEDKSSINESKLEEIKSIDEASENTAQENQINTNPAKTMTTPSSSVDGDNNNDAYERLKQGRAVPSTRTGRAFGFASLGMGMALGAVGEGLSRLTGRSTSSNIMMNDGNADRLAASLCRMRGAALKLGQMLSIQDETLLPPELSRALKQVRQGADAMPDYQLEKQLEAQLGDNWKGKFVSFDKQPFAAASIGQCHRAQIRVADENGKEEAKDVVVKVQYPGVGNSITSDLRNMSMLVKWTGLAPKGLFLDNVIRVGQDELTLECDYLREAEQQTRMKKLVEKDSFLRDNNFVVPAVYDDWTTEEILTTEFVPGGTIDKVSHLSQDERNRIARTILYLTIQELFVWRFMQTDPNWGNFLYDVGSNTTSLIDFGASRDYDKSFVDGYLRIVWASANRDEERLMKQSYLMNFLTGEENDTMIQAHKQSGYTVGEPFHTNEPFDFRGSNISNRMGAHTSAFLKYRLTPPPSEVYTLHRKLAGAFMLCIKLGAVIPCRDLLENVIANYNFEDGQEPPPV